MFIAIAGYWGVGIPSAYLLAFAADFGAQGIWMGMAIGLTVVAIFLTSRFRAKAMVTASTVPQDAAVQSH
jgi:MATE family multidrug resistance protein